MTNKQMSKHPKSMEINQIIYIANYHINSKFCLGIFQLVCAIFGISTNQISPYICALITYQATYI